MMTLRFKKNTYIKIQVFLGRWNTFHKNLLPILKMILLYKQVLKFYYFYYKHLLTAIFKYDDQIKFLLC